MRNKDKLWYCSLVLNTTCGNKTRKYQVFEKQYTVLKYYAYQFFKIGMYLGLLLGMYLNKIVLILY